MEFKLKKREDRTNKGDYGRVGIIGGSTGMSGSIFLSTESALRTGSGLVYGIVPKSLETIMSIKLIEAIVKPIEDESLGYFTERSIEEIFMEIENMNVLGIGPGMGVDSNRVKLISEIISDVEIPMVIDADGLNCLSKNIELLHKKKNEIVLTPHPGEMSRLIGVSIDEIEKDRIRYAKEFSKKYNIILVLKGNKTVVSNNKGDVYINDTGNPSMATAGSGDVLTGIISSLIGQGYDVFESAKLGVYIHGLSGDISRDKLGEYGVLARDILDNIPLAMKSLIS